MNHPNTFHVCDFATGNNIFFREKMQCAEIDFMLWNDLYISQFVLNEKK